MPTLAEQVGTPPKRSAVVADLVRLVGEEVGRKSGLTGAGIKLAYGTVKAIKPTFVPDIIDHLLDTWVAKLEPVYASCVAEGQGSAGLSKRLAARAPEVADALLSVTDERAETTPHATAKKAYVKLRPTAKRHVEEAVPRLGDLLEKHTS